MKISLITVTYNAGAFIQNCIESVLSQKYSQIEYIIIDGGSTDDTIEKIKLYGDRIDYFISEKDQGIYDAMNKGLQRATGNVVGILNADDFFADENVLGEVALRFDETQADVVYGNLSYVDRESATKVIRQWESKGFEKKLFQYGWMPAHPTFYARKKLFEQYGGYDLAFGSAADYELMLRFLYKHRTRAVYLNRTMVKMRVGGVSNLSLTNRIKALTMDYRAMQKNGIRWPLIAVILKPLRKITQFF